MLCSRVRKNLHSYAMGEIKGLEYFLIKEHLDSCPTCKAEHERLKGIKSILSNMGRSVEAPYGLIANIMEAIDLERYKAVGIYAINNIKSLGLSLIAAGFIIAALSLSPQIEKSLDIKLIGRSMAKIQESIIKPFEIINSGVTSISDRISNINETMNMVGD